MEIRLAADTDATAVAELLAAADDARVISAQGWLHHRATSPARARLLQLVAELHGEVVAVGTAGLNTMTTENAAWAFVTVTSDCRRHGIGSNVGGQLLEHIHRLGAKKVTSFIRFTEEGESWATARGWSRILTGPLIAVDPRRVPDPSPPPGFRCAPFTEVEPRAVYDAVCEAALDEPSAVANDDIRLDEFLAEWGDPDQDLRCCAAVLAGEQVVSFAMMQVVGDRGQHGFTGTRRDYRGRGLATTAKRFALRAAAARGVTRVTTSNAEENAAMRAINRGLGFEQIGEHVILGRALSGESA